MEAIENTDISKTEGTGNMHRSLSKASVKAEEYAPDILTGVGLVGVVSAAVLACKATLKLPEIINEANTRLDKIDNHYNVVNNAENASATDIYDDREMKKDKIAVFADAAKKTIKLYAVPAVLMVAGITCILSAHGMMRKRNAGLALAYTGLQTAYDAYRNRVIEDAGEDKDLYYRTGYKTVNAKVFEDPDSDQSKDVKKAKVLDSAEKHTAYSRIFDESNPNWQKDRGYNLMFLRSTMEQLNNNLHANGYLFLNDVYKALGFKAVPDGQLIGWVIKDNDDVTKFVDFGIYDNLYVDDAKRDFLNAVEPSIWLDFNPDGVVYNLI